MSQSVLGGENIVSAQDLLNRLALIAWEAQP
jgi:hypothetical protein